MIVSVASGKGDTGKTSFVASYAALAGNAIVVDCDVGAPDLRLVLEPTIERREPFVGGKLARIDETRCVSRGDCACTAKALDVAFVPLLRLPRRPGACSD